MEPSLSRGPPIFCAVPPIGPSAVSDVSLLQDLKIIRRFIMKERSSVPVNIDPTAPSFENILVPVPVVFSPAAG